MRWLFKLEIIVRHKSMQSSIQAFARVQAVNEMQIMFNRQTKFYGLASFDKLCRNISKYINNNNYVYICMYIKLD